MPEIGTLTGIRQETGVHIVSVAGDGVRLSSVSTGKIVINKAVAQYENATVFPAVGDDETLYIDLSANTIFAWNREDGYFQLSGKEYQIVKDTINGVDSWDSGEATKISIAEESPTMQVVNGKDSNLITKEFNVVTDICE